MRRRERGLRRDSRILFAVLLADALFFGAAAGSASALYCHQLPDEETKTVTMDSPETDTAFPVSEDEGIALRTEAKVIALTFDDGPDAATTKLLLDGLRERGVVATFFLMGENIAGNEDLVRQMQEDGHLIGNHGFRHVQMTKEGVEAACVNIEENEKLIEGITGERPEYLRPPYGDWNEELEERLDLTPVFWTVDSLDWKLRDTTAIVGRVSRQTENGSIILMHDILPESVDAALELTDLFLQEGYTFVTADELMID
ncbi:MAG: polysaccharide deacetylase family protein [Clostridiales bacterium]|nr:polysaccharide deacetylase family protein [Clostridiales bacterium]